jgi:hypothetical protein
VGDKQYIRSALDSGWQELKGNRCERFLPLKDDPYGAFVINGEEVEAPQRTDYTIGGIFIIPWISWSTKHAAKLVLAQESVTEGSSPGWTIRAVVDPETPEDADRNFMAGVDSEGTFHFLYFATRGSQWFYIGAVPSPPGLIGGGGPSTPPNYVTLKLLSAGFRRPMIGVGTWIPRNP